MFISKKEFKKYLMNFTIETYKKCGLNFSKKEELLLSKKLDKELKIKNK